MFKKAVKISLNPWKMIWTSYKTNFSKETWIYDFNAVASTDTKVDRNTQTYICFSLKNNKNN